jgi:hypothetical protein
VRDAQKRHAPSWFVSLAHGSCQPGEVPKILVVMRGAINEESVRRCCRDLPTENAAIAVCYELPPGHDGLVEGLAAQRALTAMLRQVRGADAETIAVFVVSDREGQRVDDCASAWGATEVRP